MATQSGRDTMQTANGLGILCCPWPSAPSVVILSTSRAGKRATEGKTGDGKAVLRGKGNKSVGVPISFAHGRRQTNQTTGRETWVSQLFQGTTQYRCANRIVRVPVKTPSLVAVKAGIGALNWGSGIL